MRRFLFRLILIVILFAVIGLIGFAYVGDLSPERQEQTLPVTISDG